MAEYIEREALIEDYSSLIKKMVTAKNGLRPVSAEVVLKYLSNFPAADVVEVVRCRDCKHSNFHEFQFAVCWKRNNMVSKDGFCSYGERREGER